jgi:hypothetical protein
VAPEVWSSGFGVLTETLIQLLVIPKVRSHQTFPEPTMLGNREVEQLVDDYVVAKLAIHRNKFIVEAECSGR